MPAPNAPVPPVVDRIPVDIDLSAGINERDRQELAEWSKQLTAAENVVLTESKALVKRPGLQYLNLVDETGAAYYPVYRILPQSDGLAVVGKNFGLYHLDESSASGTLVSKGRLPEFGVERQTVSSWGSDSSNSIRAVGATSKYNVLVHESSVSGVSDKFWTIVVSDQSSNNIIRKYTHTTGVGGLLSAVVSGEYLHIFVSQSLAKTYHSVLSLATPVSESGLTWTTTDLSGPAGTSTIVGCAKTSYGGSVVAVTAGALTYVESFDSTGASAATYTSGAGYLGTGLACDGTDTYVVGVNTTAGFWELQVLDATLTLTRTVTSTLAAAASTRMSVAVDNSSNCRMVLYSRVNPVGTIYYPSAKPYKCLSADTDFAAVSLATRFTMNGWCEYSQPFYNASTDRFYVLLAKQLSGQSGSSVSRDAQTAGVVAVVDITETEDGAGAAGGLCTYRPCAVVDTYTAAIDNNDQDYGYWTSQPAPSVQSDDYSVYVGVQQRTAYLSFAYDIVRLRVLSSRHVSCDKDVIAAGVVSSYDGDAPAELGLLETPSVFLSSGGAAAIPAGLYNYTAVLEYRDALGRSHFSRMARTSSITLGAAATITVQAQLSAVTMRPNNGQFGLYLHFYRTANGRTVYYHVGSINALVGTSITDSMVDATLVARPQPLRQPGIPGASLDRYSPLAGSHITRHKDRVFYCNGSKVYYSSFAVDGEAPWFNPSFSFEVPGGSGPITALASMDGVLVVFKRDAIFLVDGDGPPENGGNGSEFSPPRRVLTEFGCPDPRMLVATPDGYMYRSRRGIELLDRSLQVKFIGRNVSATANAYPYNSGCAFDQVNGRVLFCVSDGVAADGRPAYTNGSRILCYDIDARGWTTWRPKLNENDAYSGLVDLGSAQVTINGTTSQSVFAVSEYYLARFDETTYLDYIYYQPMKLETGWVRFESAQDRIRIADFLALCKKQTNHNLKLSVAYDYSDTYSYTKTFTPATINALTLEQLELQVPSEAKMSMRFKLEDAEPADTVTYPVGTGEGPVVLALTPKVGRRGGGAKLSSDQKG